MAEPAEPTWLVNLRRALADAKHDRGVRVDIKNVVVKIEDLEAAIGRAEDGPGGTALVCAEDGKVIVDFQQLLKAVYLTPDEAREIANSMLRHANEITHGAVF